MVPSIPFLSTRRELRLKSIFRQLDTGHSASYDQIKHFGRARDRVPEAADADATLVRIAEITVKLVPVKSCCRPGRGT